MNGQAVIGSYEIATVAELPDKVNSIVAIAKPLTVSAFETKRWLYYLALPIMWFLTIWAMAKKRIHSFQNSLKPEVNTYWFDGISPNLNAVKRGAASWKALEFIYNWHFGQNKGLRGFVEDFWFGMLNAQAVRNRLKLIKQEVKRAILRFSNHQEVRILSLAAGSAQGIIEVMAELKSKGVKVKALLVDIDPSALAYAQELARKNDVIDQIAVVNASVATVSKVAQRFKPQIIEMLGLLDYIHKEKAIRLVEKIHESLEPKGIFLTCNIRHNIERHFMKSVVDWPMIYRTPADLAEIVSNAGFEDYRLVYEPLKIHGLVVAQKS